MPNKEEFTFRHKIVDESGAVRVQAGNVHAQIGGRIQIGVVELEGRADGDSLRLSGQARVSTVEADAQTSVESPVGGADASAHVEGPSAHASGAAGTDGIGGTIGASAGEASAQAGVNILGESFNVGAEVGLKAELGLHWGATSTIDLPLISISGPNPAAALTEFALNAAKNLATDPLGTTADAANDVMKAGEDVLGATGHVIEMIGGLFGDEAPDDHAVTNDNWDTSGKPAPAGQVKFD
ncbi:hypothetical protein [Occultella kanbiaonis]|uniref:hypothetical protein n=1 Tax=Occultella kanbiaonis TaxID=2675754 RepID=UPI0013CFECE9|nr:hypothetical protein [Occultella kanbiaonis]